ncbi:MAG: CdaR family protein [Bacteroidia bacterium]|jgi:YbbR domain-containing protein
MALTKLVSHRWAFFRRRNYLAFFVCLIIAALLWLLLAFNNLSSTHLSVPIRYINLPEHNILKEKLPHKAEIEISGTGYHLIRYLMRPSLGEIIVDGRNTGIKKDRAFISTYHAIEFFNRQHGDIKMVNIAPDTIFFKFLNKGLVRLPVKVASYLDFAPEFDLKDSLKITPDSISVSGPFELLKNLGAVETTPLILSGINTSGSHKVRIKNPQAELSYDPSEITINLNVDRTTEARITVPIQSEEQASLKFEPQTVTLVFQVALSNYSKIKAADFWVSAEAANDGEPSGKMRLVLKRSPYYAKKISLLPEFVNLR